MDYTLNASLFICVLRDYLATGAPGHLQRLVRAESCGHYVHETSLLLNCLQVLLLLEQKRLTFVEANPDVTPVYILDQESVVVSYALTLMDYVSAVVEPYGISVTDFDYCGDAGFGLVRRQRVRAVNGHATGANTHYLQAGTIQAPPSSSL